MIASYRLQLQPGFAFAEVEALLPYFQRLGISHLYLSPITESRANSTHGYDVIDHNAVRAEFGGREALDRLLEAAGGHQIKLILDWVPNHAGVGPRNQYWQDVLAYGRHSPYARYFDIDWRPLKPELHGKVLLPFLGRPYGEALDDGEIGLGYDGGRFYATYFESRFALCPASYDTLLATALAHYERSTPYWDLKDLLEAYRGLEPHEREKAEALRLRLAAMAERVDPTEWLALDPPDLHALLEHQNWRLASWKTAGHEINYRRFFDINELVGLRMEDGHVFWDAHRLLGELLAQETVDGVRIDHIDGLFDPHAYLERLRDLGASHIWVEKILAHGERLPEVWPVEGTTGYAFMNDVMRVLVQPAGEHVLDRAYRRFAHEVDRYDRIVHDSKRVVIETMLSSELFRLAYELDRLSEADYRTRDFTFEALREALAEVVAAFGRYRTYLPHEDEDTRRVVLEAVHLARQRNPVTEPTVYDFIARIILDDVREDLGPDRRAWVGRFQQYTAPVAAKGVEDTAFYRYLRLAALNEVGGEPDHFSVERHAFHAHARFRAHTYPRNLVATATHDHKRGEDTRMRMIALAEIPERWEETVLGLAEIGARHRRENDPSRNDEYLVYQTLAALAHDADRGELPERMATYMAKAAKESKQQTSWINTNEAYEADLDAFVRGVCSDERIFEALSDLSAELARLGFTNTISQTVLKLTTPGVPDFYQGTELFDLSLVDPDNRREVDYDLRRRLLDEMASLLDTPEPEVVATMLDSGEARAKLYLTARLLRLRREQPGLFEGDYRALEPEGEGAEGWIAYARTRGDDAMVVLISRFPATRGERGPAHIPLPEDWHRRRWTDWITGAELDPTETLSTDALPVSWAVLRAH
jgi:(1->4)-alpha-D-glucan 1-alpha-D-glucosylmutase